MFVIDHDPECKNNNTIFTNLIAIIQDCRTPSPIVFGNMKINSAYLNGTTEITCFPGFNITGGKTITCQENGNWTYPPM